MMVIKVSYNAIEVSYIGTGGEGNVETLRDFNTSYAHDCMNMVIIIIPESQTTMCLEIDQASEPIHVSFPTSIACSSFRLSKKNHHWYLR